MKAVLGTIRKIGLDKIIGSVPVHSFGSLLTHLATLCRNHCRVEAGQVPLRYTRDTEPTDLQSRVFTLLGV